jgi:hypothetical protein
LVLASGSIGTASFFFTNITTFIKRNNTATRQTRHTLHIWSWNTRNPSRSPYTAWCARSLHKFLLGFLLLTQLVLHDASLLVNHFFFSVIYIINIVKK